MIFSQPQQFLLAFSVDGVDNLKDNYDTAKNAFDFLPKTELKDGISKFVD